MRTPKGFEVDHDDENGLNNQRYNMKNVTRARNALNSSLVRGKALYRGVSFAKHAGAGRCGMWMAKININKKQTFLGYFKAAKKASLAYEGAKKRLLDGREVKRNVGVSGMGGLSAAAKAAACKRISVALKASALRKKEAGIPIGLAARSKNERKMIGKKISVSLKAGFASGKYNGIKFGLTALPAAARSAALRKGWVTRRSAL